jgi:excisionase family DNA binding protein
MAQALENADTSNQSDRYLDLRGLSRYSSLAVPTLRDYIRQGSLPHYRLRGKLLVRKSDFDAWIEQFKVDEREDLDTLVEDVVASFKN